MTDTWPDIEPNKPYIGNGQGIRGCRCTAIRQKQTSFGHKHAYVIWAEDAQPGVPVDENSGSWVRTTLLDPVEV